MNPGTLFRCLAAVAVIPSCPADVIFSWEDGEQDWTANEGASIAISATGATDGEQALAITTPMSAMWYSTPAQINLDEETRQALFTGATELYLDVSYPDPGYDSWWGTPNVELIIQGDGVAWSPLGIRDIEVDGEPQTLTWPISVGQASSLASGSWAQVILKFTYGNGGSSGTDAVFYVDRLGSTVVVVPPPEPDYFWKGGVSASWADLNWTEDAEGEIEAPALATDGTAGVAFTAADAMNFDTVLGADQHVKSITFLPGTGAVYIGGSHKLTIGEGGILVQVNGGPVTIDGSGDVELSADQLWANQSGGTLMVDSRISGDSKLTTGGSGTTFLGAANVHTGGTGVQQGTLTMGHVSALGPADTRVSVTGGTLDLNGYSPTIGGLSGSLGGVVSNLSFDPATLTVDEEDESVFNAAINDGAFGGVVSLVKKGPGILNLGGTGNFTGNVEVEEGLLIANTALFGAPNAGSFGNAQSPGRIVTIGADGIVVFNTNNVLGNQQADMAALPRFVIEGGILDATRYNLIGDIALDGGLLSQSSSDAGAYQGYQFKGNIDVTGSVVSFITSNNGKANHLSAETVFDVADVTGDEGPDLIVTNPLADQSGDFAEAPGGLRKTGAGTLALDGFNTYTGATRIGQGRLVLAEPSLGDSSLVEIAEDAMLELDFLGTDTIGSLIIGGQVKEPGTYGPEGSGAEHELEQFAGFGMLLVRGDAFAAWIAGFPSLDDDDAKRESDPDDDGLTNLEEFAFDGDPTDGAAAGKFRSRVETVDGEKALVITLPVRTGAELAGNAPALLTSAADGLIYRIGGSNDLAEFDQSVSEVTPAMADAPALPELSDGWTYRSFRLDGAIDGETPRGPRGFLQVTVLDTR